MRYFQAIWLFGAAAQLVAGHGAIVRVEGDAGGRGSAIGINPNTPRDGTRRRPFQQDSTRFRGPNRDTCGETIGAGQNNIQNGVRTVMQQNGDLLPQVNPGGVLSLTIHQVNGDGAGPYRCEVDDSGFGRNFRSVTVELNVPGRNGNSRNTKTDFPVEIRIPDDMRCSGNVAGQNNVCMGRCKNPARAGPFGGCFPFQIANRNDGNRNNNNNNNNNNNFRNNNDNFRNNNNNNNNFRNNNDNFRNNNDNNFRNNNNNNNFRNNNDNFRNNNNNFRNDGFRDDRNRNSDSDSDSDGNNQSIPPFPNDGGFKRRGTLAGMVRRDVAAAEDLMRDPEFVAQLIADGEEL